MAVSTPNPEHLHGLVDMGSNGIRFSITDLSPPTTRILPTLYTSRAGISLYDAQYSTSGDRIAIPEKTIAKVIDKLTHFKRTCADFRVPESNITILATEATRTAVNSAEFRSAIKSATDWEVQLLAKEDEGRVAAAMDVDSDEDSAIFRVSQRRANQVPAVAFLVTALSEALPHIKEVRFCQGGVREGYLFSKLPLGIRKQSPVVVATASLASPGSPHYADLLLNAIPKPNTTASASISAPALSPPIITAFANLSGHFSSHPKDIRAAAALRSTTTDLPPTDIAFFHSMQSLAGAEQAWWASNVAFVNIFGVEEGR
ncbi:unnamed protein product [Aureobasidium pullulans]|nr:unnamed protein product [Aureobasidium pullulans]